MKLLTLLLSIALVHSQDPGHVVGVRYQDPFVGPCRGPGGTLDKVNGRSAIEHTQAMCEQACDNLVDCTGYSYCASCNGGECNLHGPGLDGGCSDASAKNPADCAKLGTCVEDNTKTREGTCGACSEATATSMETCASVGAAWTAMSWNSAGATWEDAEDPWEGSSHPSVVIKGSTEESESLYLCYDIHPEDHWALCTGSEECEALFAGKPEDERLEETCASPCAFLPAPTVPKPKPPHAGDIRLPGWNPAMSGACRGGSDFTSKVNGKYSNTAGANGKLTQEECATECLAEAECVGYAHSTAWCIVYGMDIHDTPGQSWTADLHVETVITGTKPNPSYICVTGPPRQPLDAPTPNTSAPMPTPEKPAPGTSAPMPTPDKPTPDKPAPDTPTEDTEEADSSSYHATSWHYIVASAILLVGEIVSL